MTATNLNVELAALQLGSKLFDTLCHSLKILLKITKWTGCNWSNDDWCGDISVLELHPKLELLKLSGFGKTVILSVFIVARIWLWPDSRHLKLLSSPRCCLCFPLIPPPWRNAPRLWRVHYWSPPSTGWYTLTHTHTPSEPIILTRCAVLIYGGNYDRTERLWEKTFSLRGDSWRADPLFNQEWNISI